MVLQNQNKLCFCCWHTESPSLPCLGQTFHLAMMTPEPLCTMAKEGTTGPHLPMAFLHMEVSPRLALTLEPSHRHLTLASLRDPTLVSLEDTQMLVLCQARGIHLMGCLPCPTLYHQPCPAQVSFVLLHCLTPCLWWIQLVESSYTREHEHALRLSLAQRRAQMSEELMAKTDLLWLCLPEGNTKKLSDDFYRLL